MTSHDVEISLDISQLVDMDNVPKCAARRNKDCGNEATWVLTSQCCGNSCLFCSDCKAKFLVWMGLQPSCKCKHCGGHDPEITWRKL